MNDLVDSLMQDPCASMTGAIIVFVAGKFAVGDRERLKQVGAVMGSLFVIASILYQVFRGFPTGSMFYMVLITWVFCTGISWLVLCVWNVIDSRLKEIAQLEKEQQEK